MKNVLERLGKRETVKDERVLLQVITRIVCCINYHFDNFVRRFIVFFMDPRSIIENPTEFIS